MKIQTSFSLRVCVAATLAVSAAGSAIPAPMTAAQTQRTAESDVIVILRDQLDRVPAARRAMTSRALAVAAAQSAVVSQLQGIRARKVHSFGTINAFATSATAAEVADLSDAARHPEIQAVVPDRVIHALRRRESIAPKAASAGVAAAPADGLCNTLEPEALQVTKTAFLSATSAQAQSVLDGRGQPVTGKGVKVAFLADNMDPNVSGFIRPDGSHVFIDYQDFTGDPAGTPTDGAEAYGDASSIAAQDMPKGKVLSLDISKYVSTTHPLPSPCNIRIRGMAPGASLVGLPVFSGIGLTTTSNFVQAIEYAVTKADVDVINESFGGNPYPDTQNDPITLANAAAVQAGVTITVSSGDAGTAGTQGTPGTSPEVINVGATTTYRIDAQEGQGIEPLLPAKGYVGNNISPISSGGFATLAPRTIDVVAPGDGGWALCSTNIDVYTGCADDNGGASGLLSFGGTSESAPLTAGAAALVIQAYRSTHGGKDPSPALVKQILMSSATDLGAPTFEQGAGLINALGAVHLALSIVDGNGSPKPHGHGLLSSVNSVVITAGGNTHESAAFKITNTGSTPRIVTPSLQTLGDTLAGANLYVQLNPSSDPTFLNVVGASRSYVKQKFTVPANMQHLDVAIAYPQSLTTSPTLYVYLALTDPAGRMIQYSLPQGSNSGYAHVDVVKPVAGVYTAYVYTRTTGVGSYTGPVELTWAAERFVDLGKVYPTSATIAPGATQTFTADFFTPSEPGDLAAGIRFVSTDGNYDTPSIPITMRTLVQIGPVGGNFSGVLTGGNARGSGNQQTFEFDVPVGVRDMSVAVPVADNNYLLSGLLIDPNGMQLSVTANLDPANAPQYGLQNYHYNPQPGRWRYLLVQAPFSSSGNQTSLPFTGRIGFNLAKVAAPTLPNSAGIKLSATGRPVKVELDFINTGSQTAAYFADARLSTSTAIILTQVPDCAATATLPGTCAEFVVPTQTTKVSFTAQSSVPIQMDAFPYAGLNGVLTESPDLFAKKISSTSVTASLSEREIPYGTWIAVPSEIGPYKATGAPTKKVTLTGSVVTKPFDAAVSADSGDIWADLTLGSNTFNPVFVAPGEEGSIILTFMPNVDDVGKTVSGFIYLDTYSPGVASGDEVVRLPYMYTVSP